MYVWTYLYVHILLQNTVMHGSQNVWIKVHERVPKIGIGNCFITQPLIKLS